MVFSSSTYTIFNTSLRNINDTVLIQCKKKKKQENEEMLPRSKVYHTSDVSIIELQINSQGSFRKETV